MEAGNSLYQDGRKVGVIVYVSAFSLRDSKNPQFATADKANQFSLIVEAPENFGLKESSVWEIGHDSHRRRVKILDFHYGAGRAIMAVEVLPAA